MKKQKTKLTQEEKTDSNFAKEVELSKKRTHLSKINLYKEGELCLWGSVGLFFLLVAEIWGRNILTDIFFMVTGANIMAILIEIALIEKKIKDLK